VAGDNADVKGNKFSEYPTHHGEGDGTLGKKTIFDDESTNSDDLISPGLNDSTDAFYKDVTQDANTLS